MNISKDDARMALDRITEGRYGDPYGSDRAVEHCAFEALKEEVEDLRTLVRYLAHQALNR
jgi:hypothetical protein